MKKDNKLYWRRLDNSAKIFPISAGKKYSTVFRFSCVLKEKIDPKILQKAVPPWRSAGPERRDLPHPCRSADRSCPQSSSRNCTAEALTGSFP